MDSHPRPSNRPKPPAASPQRCQGLLTWGLAALFLLQILSEPAAFARSEEPPLSGDDRASPANEVTRRQLGEAIKLYQRSDFEGARDLLQQILKRVGTGRLRVAQEAYTYMAFVHVAFNEQDRAVAAFERALTIQPTMTLASPSPRISAALEQARQRYRAKVRALDHDPPHQTHAPIQRAQYNQSLLLSNTVKDLSGVKRVMLHYRIKGLRGFSSVKMERGKKGLFIATIPATAVVRPGVEYYLEAWDVLGNGPGLKGSPALPIHITVEGGPATPGGAVPGGWYTKWWVWAIVSGAALTVGAATAIPYLAREQRARIDVRLIQDKPAL